MTSPIRVAINGFGRIGRAVFRIIAERTESEIEVVAINDLADDDILAYLLEYDSVMGPFEQEVQVKDGVMTVGKHEVKMLYIKDPSELPWKELAIDVVVESTGVFRTRESLQKHIDAGAKRVILTVPADDEIDDTVVLDLPDDVRGRQRGRFAVQPPRPQPEELPRFLYGHARHVHSFAVMLRSALAKKAAQPSNRPAIT